jgi:hypothetical protein
MKRIGLDANFDEQYKDHLSLTNTIRLHAERIYTNLYPEFIVSVIDATASKLKTKMSSAFPFLLLLYCVALCLFLPILYRGSLRLFGYRKPNERLIILLIALTGFAWLIPLKRLFVFHDYTAMYYAGFHVLFMCALLLGLKDNVRKLALPICFIIFVFSLYTIETSHNENLKVSNLVTADFNEIQEKLNRINQEIYIDGGIRDFIPGAEWALGFYLPEQWLSERPQSPFAVSYNSHFGNKNLTPTNKYIFLFKQ